MKKTIIYSLCILLTTGCFLSSCEDMLSVDSDRVEYDLGPLTLNDTVYSVLGILKAVQGVVDRQVLFGELRADLLTLTPAAVTDIQSLASFNFAGENKYLNIKDYYTIINNCNLYLARVDTTLERNNTKLMLPEYVAVKSVRAWTYIQLALNYKSVPYYTEPILTNKLAEEVMKRPKKGIEELIPIFIEDLQAYEDPEVYYMPQWKGVTTGNGGGIYTSKLFMPIRQLLGELYLLKGDYATAAYYYYRIIEEYKFTDVRTSIEYMNETGTMFSNRYTDLFYSNSYISSKSGPVLTVVPFQTSTSKGTVSELSEIFAPEIVTANQVEASQGWIALNQKQTYLYKENKIGALPFYNPNINYPGDLRRVASLRTVRDVDTTNELVINKFNASSMDGMSMGSGMFWIMSSPTTRVPISRAEQVYLRLAECVAGLARQDWGGATDLLMDLMKNGAKDRNYPVWKDYAVAEGEVPMGDTIYFNFTDAAFSNTSTGGIFVSGNNGIHSRGSGVSKDNIYYALSDTCIARYIDVLDEDTKEITRELTKQDTLNYVTDLVIDELALEMAFEGHRFTDLIRFAKSMDDRSVLAKRVAGRAFKNTVSYRSPAFQYDAALYDKLMNEDNWYLPIK